MAAVQRLPYAGERPGHGLAIRSTSAYDKALARNGRWDPNLPKELRDGAGGQACAWFTALLEGDELAQAAAWNNLPRKVRLLAPEVAAELKASGETSVLRFAQRMRTKRRAWSPDRRRPNQPGRDADGRPLAEFGGCDYARVAVEDYERAAADAPVRSLATDELHQLRDALIEAVETYDDGPSARAVARQILAARGGVARLDEAAALVAAEMDKPVRKEGRRPAYAGLVQNRAAFERREQAKAWVGRIFSLCGIRFSPGSTEQAKQLSRAAAAAFEAPERPAPIAVCSSELTAAQRRELSTLPIDERKRRARERWRSGHNPPAPTSSSPATSAGARRPTPAGKDTMSDIQAPSGAAYAPIDRSREIDPQHARILAARLGPDSIHRTSRDWHRTLAQWAAWAGELPEAAFRFALSLMPIWARRVALAARSKAEGLAPVAISYDHDVTVIVAEMSGRPLPPQVGVNRCKACQAHGGVNNRVRPYPYPAHIAHTYGPGAHEMICGGVWLN